MEEESKPSKEAAAISPEECQKKAAELGFDLTKQFLTLAFAGIAFVVGMSFNTPGVVSGFMLWSVVAAFGVSAAVGLLFLMHGVGRLGRNKYDLYAPSLRILSALQILLMLLGTIFLVPILSRHEPSESKMQPNTVQIKLGSQRTVVYPVDPSKKLTIELSDNGVSISQEKQ